MTNVGVSGRVATSGLPGPPGPPGVTGADGSARAFGFVKGATVTRSKNVVKVTNPQAEVFCVTLDPSISLATVVPTASPDFNGDDTGAAAGKKTYVEPQSVSISCLVTELEVDSGFAVAVTGMAENEPFWFTVN